MGLDIVPVRVSAFAPVTARARAARGRIASTSEALEWVLAVVAEEGEGCRDWPGACNAKGYGQMGYEGRTRQVGHLVLEFSGRPRPAGAHQIHSCDRTVCAAPWHLRWGNNDENRADSVAKGRSSKGEDRPQAKLTADAVREIRTSGRTLADLAAQFGVGVPTVQKARVGETWKHIIVDEMGEVGIVIEDGQVAAARGGGVMATRYSVTASCGLLSMRRDFATLTEAMLWREVQLAEGWTVSQPSLIDVPTAMSTTTVPVRRAL